MGVTGIEATRSFQVDTVAPRSPVMTARPSFPTSSATPGFGWTIEPGASSRWRVAGANGAALQQSDTPLTSTTVGPLVPGAYNFRVSQVDAAGNESAAAVEAFSIVGPPRGRSGSRSPCRASTPGACGRRAGTTVLTRRPLLRWRGGPPGTRIFNLQVFRVQKTRTAGRTPPVRKIYSVFPAKRRYTMPKVKIQPGTCYVWRVWPFVGKRFTGQPLGVSNFCVATKKVLRQRRDRRPASPGEVRKNSRSERAFWPSGSTTTPRTDGAARSTARYSMRSMVGRSPRRRPPRFMALAIAGAAGSLVLAGTAGAVPSPPGGLGASPASPTQSHDVTVSWTDATPDPGETITGYVGGLNGAVGPVAPGAIDAPRRRVHLQRPRGAVRRPASAHAVGIPIVVDNGAARRSRSGSPRPPNAAGWRRRPDDRADLHRRPALTAVVRVRPFAMDDRWRDRHGARSRAPTPPATRHGVSVAFKYDATAAHRDRRPADSSRAPAALVATEPAFSWTPGADATSGVGQVRARSSAT